MQRARQRARGALTFASSQVGATSTRQTRGGGCRDPSPLSLSAFDHEEAEGGGGKEQVGDRQAVGGTTQESHGRGSERLCAPGQGLRWGSGRARKAGGGAGDVARLASPVCTAP